MPQLRPEIISELRGVAEQYSQGCPKPFRVIKKPIGVGGSAVVFRIVQDGVSKALKIYDKKFFAGEEAKAQEKRIELQKRLIGIECPSLVQIYEIELYEGTCISITEYVEWKELKSSLANIEIGKIQQIVDDLLFAIEVLEREGLIHRDIKPENILISPKCDKIKLVDFGVVREISAMEDRLDGTDHGKQRPFLATAQYSSPEYLFRTEEPSPTLWESLNLYQMGAVVHDLISQEQLFNDEMQQDNRYRLALAVLKRKPQIPLDKRNRNSRLATLAEYALTKDPALRRDLVCLGDFRDVAGDSNKSKLVDLLRRREIEAKQHFQGEQRAIEEELNLDGKLELLLLATLDRINSDLRHWISFHRVSAQDAHFVRTFNVAIRAADASLTLALALSKIRDVEQSEYGIYIKEAEGGDGAVAVGVLELGTEEFAPIVDKLIDYISSQLIALLENT